MANEWTSVQQVAKDANNNYVALVNNEWVPVAGAAKDASGNYMAYGLSSKYTPPKAPTPEVSTGEAVGAGFLSGALGLSRFFGGDVAESQTKAREAEEVAAEQRPIATAVGKFMPSAIAAAPGLVAAAPLTAGMGVLGTMGVETALAGVPVGGGMGAERYQQVLDATGDPELARKAAIATGAINAVGVGAPASLGGGLLKRMAGGATINVPLGEADIAAQNALLKDYPGLQQEQFDPANMGLQAGMGALFGAFGPRHLPTSKTSKVDTTTKSDLQLRTEENERTYIEAALDTAIFKRDNLQRQVKELETQLATGDLDAQSRITLDKLNSKLDAVNEEVAKLQTPIGGKVADTEPEQVTFKYETEGGTLIEETGSVIERKGTKYIRWQDGTLENGKPTYRMIELDKAKDVQTSSAKGLDEPTTNKRVDGEPTPLPDDDQLPRSDFDEKMEGVSRESDVPPHLQQLDREIDGVNPAHIIQEEQRSEWQQHKDGLVQKHNEVQDLLDDINSQLEDHYNSGSSFTPYVEKMEQNRVKLEKVLDDYADRIAETDRLIANEKQPTLSNPDRQSLATKAINETLKDTSIPVADKPAVIARRVSEIYAGEIGGVHYVGSKTFKDTILSTFADLNKITGQKEQMIVVYAPNVSTGSFHAVGNKAVFFVSERTRTSAMDAVRRMFRPEDVARAALVHNIGHEYGHFYMTKIVQAYGSDTSVIRQMMVGFDKYTGEGGVERLRQISSMPLAEKLEGENYVRKAGYYEKFPEYFAEAFNRAINSGKLPDNAFLRDAYLGLRKVSDKIFEKLRDFGILISKNDYSTQFINDFLASNKTYLEAAGRNLDTSRIKSVLDHKLQQNVKEGKSVFSLEESQRHIHDKWNSKEDKDYVPINTEQVVEEQRNTEDASWLSTKFATNFFGFPQLQQILSQVPLIRAISRAIDNADYKAEQISKALLHGIVDYANWKASSVKAGFVTNLQHYKNMDSVATLLQKMPSTDFAALERVFRKGFNESLEYAETLRKYGHELNDEQKHAFTVMSDMFRRQWEEVVKLGINLPQRKGWYPSVRSGDHFVEMRYNGVIVYRQQVRTAFEANRISKAIQESGKYKNLEIEVGKKQETRAEMEQREFITSAILTELSKRGHGDAFSDIEALLDRLESKPKLGKHHEQRANILGYKGTEIFGDDELRGLSFKEAIKSSADDYTGTIRKILISRETNPLLNTPNGLDESHPNTFYAAKLIRDMATNKVNSSVEGFDNYIKNVFDKLFQKVMGKESKLPFYDRMTGVASHIFYMQALTMKAGFWLSQLVSSPLALRHFLREDSVVGSLATAGKGTQLMVHPDEGFMKCVYWLSQNTNSYHPSLINELTKLPLHDMLKEGSMLRRITDVLTGETPSSMADSFSRYWTSAMMYAHYSKLGYKGEALYKAVAKGTDTTMVRYEKRYRAPGLQKLGIVGEAIAPLHTFAQAQWGNMVADIMHGKKTGNWAPLAATYLVSIALGGVIGAPLVAEYEFIRKAFGMEEYMPSIVELAMKSGSDSLAFGPLINTGFDFGSSLRSNPLIPGLIEANGSLLDLFPVVKYGATTVGNLGTIAKQKLGGSVSDAEYRKAVLGVMPKGWMTGLTEDIKFGATEREMVPTSSGAGLIPQTGKERAASYLGVRTAEAAKESKQYQLMTESDKTRSDKVKKQIDILGDAMLKGDDDKINSALGKLNELGVPPDSVQEQLMSELSGRQRSLTERYIFGAKGKGGGYESQRRLFNFGEYNE